jgi:hypothetical protein
MDSSCKSRCYVAPCVATTVTTPGEASVRIASRIGDPECFVVHQPDEHTSRHIHECLFRGGSIDLLSMLLPADAFHLVLWNTYYCAVANLHFRHNLIEVPLLNERGVELSGWEQAYFPAHQIREWLEKHCAAKQRNRPCLSALQKKTANHQLSLDTMYNYNI